MRNKAREGFTLVEALITLSIISITLWLGLPAMDNLHGRLQARQEIELIHRLIRSSREQAIILRQQLTVCPLRAGSCTRNWNDTLTVFTDVNNNRTLDTDESVIKQLHKAGRNVERSFTGTAISFDSRGFSGFNTGSFGYCRTLNSEYRSSSVIISRLGRIRPGKDSDGDGIYETAGNKNIPCPSQM